MEDIRWQQRFSNFKKAIAKLAESVVFIEENKQTYAGETMDELIKEGLIQRFEYTHELAWNVMKDYAIYQGNPNISGSRDSTREAFKLNLIENADMWMDMIQSRNKTSHTYNESTANEIFDKIINDYFPLFVKFENTMQIKTKGD